MVDNRVKKKKPMWISIVNKTSSLMSHFAKLNSPHIGLMFIRSPVGSCWILSCEVRFLYTPWKHGYRSRLHTCKVVTL
jgi:hypothetical protein